MQHILILYSSPADEDRLRLDREHRRIDDALAVVGVQTTSIDRRHAATIDDLARAIASERYEIIHFSGHGTKNGFYFDTPGSDSGQWVTAEHLCRLLQATQPALCALVLMSCHSADLATKLLSASPYVVSVSGAADDSATIDFVGYFYEHYLRTASVENAVKFSSALIDDRLNIVLVHRSQAATPIPRVVVHPNRFHDPIYVDCTEAKETIEKLDISADRFISMLSRKLRVHRWIFEGERENAIIPIGGYFARFSWKNARDVVYCHWVCKPRPGLSIQTCEAVADLIVVYNDIYVSAYRRNPKPVSQQDPHIFRKGLNDLNQLLRYFLKNEVRFAILDAINQDAVRMLRATCHANLSMADQKVAAGDLAAAAIYAETALSSIHDTIESLVESIAS